MIHQKFKNFYHQRLNHNDGVLIIDGNSTPVEPVNDFRPAKRDNLPKELEFHELEESREYRLANERRPQNSNS